MTTINKNVIILAVALAIAGFFTAYQPITPELAIVSSISVVIFALPSFWEILKIQGKKRGLLTLLALCGYALLVETSALKTGFPYGDFIYTDSLGNKVFGLTPWTVAFAYPPILLLAYWVGRRFNKLWAIVVVTAISATLVDLVLDPAAVRLGFWYWSDPGFYYGVPLVNFLGWLFSSSVGALILHSVYRNYPVTNRLAYSGLAIVWFWTWVEWSLSL